MGNTIIKASYAGSTFHFGVSYPGPASDEEMKIAKRAAEYTRAKWDSTKKSKNKIEKPKLNSEIKKDRRKKVKVKVNSKNKNKESAPTDIRQKSSKPSSSPNSRATKILSPAQKLGISESEFTRRLAALQKFHSK